MACFKKPLMKLLSKYHLPFFVAFISLMAGYFNYLLFQPDIILFKFFGVQASAFTIKNNLMRNFFTCYFSDTAWCFALCCIAFALVELKYIKEAGKIQVLAVPFISEIMQYFGIIKGTFDWFDMLIYAIIISGFYSFHSILKKYTHEKC